MTVLRVLRILQCMFTTKMKAYFQPWIPCSIFKIVLTKMSVFSMKIVKIKTNLIRTIPAVRRVRCTGLDHAVTPDVSATLLFLSGVFRSASEPLLCSPNLCYSPSLKRYFSYTSLCTVCYCELFTQQQFSILVS